MVLQGYLYDFCYIYVDDLILCSETFEDHLEHMEKGLARFADAGLSLKLGKLKQTTCA